MLSNTHRKGCFFAMKQTARLAMIDLTPEEEAQLEADFEQMTAFGKHLAAMQEEADDA